MSVKEFEQFWQQRFPESPLPGAWEEDVRANLEKHKQKVSVLKEELRKEEFYVEYLERLLSDVEQHKRRCSIKERNDETADEICDVMPDSISKVNIEDAVTPPTTPMSNDEIEVFSANMCVNEISSMSKSQGPVSPSAPEPDSGTFVTVIEVNGVKQAHSPIKVPPKIPARPPESLKNINKGPPRLSNSDSVSSSSEFLANSEEPYYDMVAPEDEYTIVKSNHSSLENVFSSSSTLPLSAKRESIQTIQEPQSPGTSNYVNIEYFIQATKKNGNSHSSSEDEAEDPTKLRRNTDNSSYASSSSLESMTPSTRRKFVNENELKAEGDRMDMYKCILANIISSESNYVEWLGVLLQYMKPIQATVHSSQPIATESELQTIFYKIQDLYNLHCKFLETLKSNSQKNESVGECFKNMASNLVIYGAFLSNYGRALDTVRKCSQANSQFNEIAKNITCKHLSDQPVTLEELLHKPVARVQKNALVLHDLLKHVSENHPDFHSLNDALKLTRKFLDEFNIIQTKSMFPTNDRAQRRLVKNSFIVEFDGHRKLRHLFLFNDVIACAKYKSSGRTEKYTFELKWFIPVEDILILEETTANPHEIPSQNIVSLKSQASNVRDQLRQEEKAAEDKKIRMTRGSDKFRKRLMELESQLVLVSPNLLFRIKHRHLNKTYHFFLSSDFERTQWIDTIQTLQKTGKPPTSESNSYSMLELQTWITACRDFLKTNMGSYLLRNAQDESLLVGDLHVYVNGLEGLDFQTDLYVCIEVDFYGHFFQKAKTKLICNSSHPVWAESFIIDLEGCENLRVLVYRDTRPNDTLFGKDTQKLSRKWLNSTNRIVERNFSVNGCTLKIGLKFLPCELNNRRVPTGKMGALFGEKMQLVCKRQKRDIPFIITACIREVERRGMSEVGIYRVSGSAIDITKLKKSFETNSYEAEQLLKDVDIHSVTGILKLYLRELPEALFTDMLYPTLLDAFNQSNNNLSRRTELLKECFSKLPTQNAATIKYILDHLMRVNKHEAENKMSLHNLATVFGPTLLRPAAATSKQLDARHTLAAGTVDVMAQAGILYCYLQDLNSAQKIGR